MDGFNTTEFQKRSQPIEKVNSLVRYGKIYYIFKVQSRSPPQAIILKVMESWRSCIED